MTIKENWARKGITDLFLTDSNQLVLHNFAKSLIKNGTDFESNEAALEVICNIMTDIYTLLQKKIISKDILFKYTQSKKIEIPSVFTKATLIEKIIEFWRTDMVTTDDFTPDASCEMETRLVNSEEDKSFPIFQFTNQFIDWFFKSLNANTINVNAFWEDSYMKLIILSKENGSEDVIEHEATCPTQILATLMEYKRKYNIFFNPNPEQNGAQGKMDPHGLVVVAVCGTLHISVSYVGVFEMFFGMMRDPFSLNNWKIKNLNGVLRSQSAVEAGPMSPMLSIL